MRPTFLSVATAALALLGSYARLGHAQGAAEKPRNLKVLPADLTRDSVVKLMRFTVASGLGVTCTYCHGAPGVPFDSIDFASDERQTKRTAREMMRMVARINSELMPTITARGTPPIEVECITCHRGAQRPLMLEDTLGTVLGRFGPDSAIATYERIKQRYTGRFAYDFGQRSLNTLADRLLEQNRTADARRILELDVREHPEAWDPAYQLGRVYETLGEKDLAIEQYRRVMVLFPTYAPARRRVEALTGKAP
ncbi:MAG TPA: c-type cytochrome [Gemmatimonadaceae bacterium]|nr:c-type cytochrome [Gemmatimonadaceae bacterium]